MFVIPVVERAEITGLPAENGENLQVTALSGCVQSMHILVAFNQVGAYVEA